MGDTANVQEAWVEKYEALDTMSYEKILIVYPTLIQAGLAISAYMEPTPFITVGDFSSPLSLYITTAVVVDSSKEYITAIDVLFDNESVLDPDANKDSDASQNFMFTKTDESSNLIGTQLYITGVMPKQPGIYDIKLELFEVANGDEQILVDMKTCSVAIVKTTLRN